MTSHNIFANHRQMVAAVLILSASAGISQAETFCNPLDLPYRYATLDNVNE